MVAVLDDFTVILFISYVVIQYTAALYLNDLKKRKSNVLHMELHPSILFPTVVEGKYRKQGIFKH